MAITAGFEPAYLGSNPSGGVLKYAKNNRIT